MIDLAGHVRRLVIAGATAPFTHAPYPLRDTLDHRGDPGLLGPDSVSWPLIADVSAFVGGIRSLLIQAAHPEVVAGVGDHSRYQDDPLGRLSRTSAYVTATTFGAIPEVEQAVSQVRRIHRVVSGVSARGVPYDADDPVLSAWVHNVLTDSFLAAYQAYGPTPLTDGDADRFVVEQARIGILLDADPMPVDARGLSHWVSGHPDLGDSPEMRDAVAFLLDPPLSTGIRIGYRLLLEAAIAIIPWRLREVLGLRGSIAGEQIGRATVSGLRWALGFSPSWALALDRCGRERPPGMFRQPPGGPG